MRTNEQLSDISERANCGYVILQQSMTETRETQILTDPPYSKLFQGYTLLLALDNLSLTLAERNLAADKLVREGFVVKQQVDELYAEEGYWEDYVNFTQ